jgi:hypothetical protein
MPKRSNVSSEQDSAPEKEPARASEPIAATQFPTSEFRSSDENFKLNILRILKGHLPDARLL